MTRSLHVLGLEGDEVDDQLGLGARAASSNSRSGSRKHDAVVAVHGLHVDAEPLAHPGRHAQRPRRVHLRAERRVHRHPPVAELVAEPLDDDGAVVGHVAGGLALLVEVGERLSAAHSSSPAARDPLAGRPRASAPTSSRTNAPDGAAQLGRPAQRVALPERQLARAGPGAGVTSTRSWVMSSIRHDDVPRVKTSPTRDS